MKKETLVQCGSLRVRQDPFGQPIDRLVRLFRRASDGARLVMASEAVACFKRSCAKKSATACNYVHLPPKVRESYESAGGRAPVRYSFVTTSASSRLRSASFLMEQEAYALMRAFVVHAAVTRHNRKVIEQRRQALLPKDERVMSPVSTGNVVVMDDRPNRVWSVLIRPLIQGVEDNLRKICAADQALEGVICAVWDAARSFDKGLRAKYARSPQQPDEYASAATFLARNQHPLDWAPALGSAAASICRTEGYSIRTRQGKGEYTSGMYPVSVLKRAINEVIACGETA